MAAPAPSSPQHAAESTASSTKDTNAPQSSSPVSETRESTAPAELTYLSVKRSPLYAEAKSLLASGEFDAALSLVEAEMIRVRTSAEREGEAEGAELHEALAPLYYLYGTTLLYSVEESDVMMAGEGKPQDTEVNPADDEEDDDAEIDKNEADSEQPDEQEPAADPAQDLEIAWENLDIARSILSAIAQDFDAAAADETAVALKSDSATPAYTSEQRKEMLLDLAQIHTRLGDVQRANGNASSIGDYSRSLEIRRDILGEFDKLVADNHYCLAQAYGEAPAKEKERQEGVNDFVASLGGGGNTGGGGMSEEEIASCRAKTRDHFLACGVAFAGYLAKMCGEDAEEVTKADIDASTEAAAAFAAGAGASSNHSQTLQIIRERLSKLTPLPDADTEEFEDKKEFIDEIQESLNEAEGEEKALMAIAEMKANEIRKHKGGEEKVETGGVTTTIGFGAPSSSTAAASASAVAAPTMMVVKKKKKPVSMEQSGVSKRAKFE